MLFGSTSSLGAFCPQHIELSTLSADPDVILERLVHPRLHLHQEPRSQTILKTLKITIYVVSDQSLISLTLSFFLPL